MTKCSDYISSEGYGICYERNHNRIIINLPPTSQTVTNTVEQLVHRKVDLTDNDLILLLNIVQYICKGNYHD